jgi:hypothetical protein
MITLFKLAYTLAEPRGATPGHVRDLMGVIAKALALPAHADDQYLLTDDQADRARTPGNAVTEWIDSELGTGKIPAVTVHTGTYADGEESPHSVISEDRDARPCLEDIQDGYLTPVDMAVHIIRDTLYIRGRYAASGGPEWPGPHTWFAAEPYQHPAMAEREEVTAHLTGFTDDQAREIWQRVTAE